MFVVEIKNNDRIIVRRASTKDLKEIVYALVSLIPIGKVTSYKAIASLLGIHHRLIARFMALNDKPIIIPCHRVVMSNGSLGGYSRGGKVVKEKILRLEGVNIVNGKVLKEYIISGNELLN